MRLGLQDCIGTYTTKDGAAHEFDALEFLAALSVHTPKTYESLNRYFGRYSCKRLGERANLSHSSAKEQESDYRQEVRKSSWAACIKKIYQANPLECPKCKAQMRIIAFIHDEHSIKDIMKAQGIPDFQAPPPIPKFIDAAEALDEIPWYDSFEPFPDDFQPPLTYVMVWRPCIWTARFANYRSLFLSPWNPKTLQDQEVELRTLSLS
jgi:hypothetical protein